MRWDAAQRVLDVGLGLVAASAVIWAPGLAPLPAMNNFANTLPAQGNPAGARILLEQVLEAVGGYWAGTTPRSSNTSPKRRYPSRQKRADRVFDEASGMPSRGPCRKPTQIRHISAEMLGRNRKPETSRRIGTPGKDRPRGTGCTAISVISVANWASHPFAYAFPLRCKYLRDSRRSERPGKSSKRIHAGPPDFSFLKDFLKGRLRKHSL